MKTIGILIVSMFMMVTLQSSNYALEYKESTSKETSTCDKSKEKSETSCDKSKEKTSTNCDKSKK